MPHPRIMFRLHPQSSLLCLNIFDHFRITLYSSHQYRYHQLGSQCQCSRPRIGSFLFKYLMCVYTRDIQSFPCPRSFKKMQIASIACPRNPIPLQCFAAAMDAHVQARLVLGHVRARSGVLWASIFFWWLCSPSYIGGHAKVHLKDAINFGIIRKACTFRIVDHYVRWFRPM